MSVTNSAVAIFHSHAKAEGAVRELQRSGFDMKKLSIVGKDYHTEEHVVGYYNAGDRMMYWGTTGVFWGGFWSLLFGSAFFAIPGIGPVLVAGPLTMWIVGALESAAVVGGLSALGAALASVWIPNKSVLKYEAELKNGNLLIVVHGSPDELERAKDILHYSNVTATVHCEPTTVSAL